MGSSVKSVHNWCFSKVQNGGTAVSQKRLAERRVSENREIALPNVPQNRGELESLLSKVSEKAKSP